MRKGTVVVLIVIGVAMAVAVAHDLQVGQKGSARRACSVEHRWLLPDACTGGCVSDRKCIQTQTRPYLQAFVQAADCACAIRLGSGDTTPSSDSGPAGASRPPKTPSKAQKNR